MHAQDLKLLEDRHLNTADPMEATRGLAERISIRLDREEREPTDPYRERRKPLLRAEAELVLGSIAKTIDYWTKAGNGNPAAGL